MAENILIFLRFGRVAFCSGSFACGRIEFSGGVPRSRVGLGRGIAFAFHCAQVEYAGAIHVAYVVEDTHDSVDVMAVERAEVSYVETFKEILLLADERFEAVVEAQERTLAPVAYKM